MGKPPSFATAKPACWLRVPTPQPGDAIASALRQAYRVEDALNMPDAIAAALQKLDKLNSNGHH